MGRTIPNRGRPGDRRHLSGRRLFEMDELNEAELLLMKFQDHFCDLLPPTSPSGLHDSGAHPLSEGEVQLASELLDQAEAAGRQRTCRASSRRAPVPHQAGPVPGDLEGHRSCAAVRRPRCWQALEAGACSPWDRSAGSNELRLHGARRGQVSKAIPRHALGAGPFRVIPTLWSRPNMRIMLAEALDKRRR